MTRKSFAGVLLLIGAVLLGVGLYLGNANVSRDGVDCGSAFGGISAVKAEVLTFDGGSALNECKATLSDRDTLAKVIAWPGGILAAVAVVALLTTLNLERKPGYDRPRR